MPVSLRSGEKGLATRGSTCRQTPPTPTGKSADVELTDRCPVPSAVPSAFTSAAKCLSNSPMVGLEDTAGPPHLSVDTAQAF